MRNFATMVLLGVFVILYATACSNGPKPINYGQDACDFCRMTIVDTQHAAQLVTAKGRNYKYDAIECMINDLSKWKRPPVKTHLVADYANPRGLTDALTASYLISEEIPSPMGAYLSAFSSEIKRDDTHSASGGEKLSWNQLLLTFGEKQDHKY
ncbi:MAG: nitrous oxide reductase accessory protein NosL [Cyclobacteriaceae bacterium]